MSDLGGARAKIKRANKHIGDLSAKKTLFLDTRPYSVTPEYYPDDDRTVYFLDRFTSTPECIPLIAGDAAHNLRSALDLLAWALYRRVKTGPGKHIYFPICETPKKYEAEAPGKVEGISGPDTKAIDMIQPYGGGNNDLWGLHQLDIADKHRLLPAPVIGVGQFGFRITAELIEREFKGFIKFSSPDAVEEKTVWFDSPSHARSLMAFKQGDPVAVIAGNRELHKDVELTFDIAFGEPEVFKGRPILETMVQLSDLVSGIVNSFELP